MAFEFKTVTFLKVYTGEDILLDDIPLYKAILREAMRLGLAGGTVLKGIEGYAAKMRGVGRAMNSFISGNADLPVIVEIVDSRENIAKMLPFLEKYADHSLVLVEESTFLITDYMRCKAAKNNEVLKGQPLPDFLIRQQDMHRENPVAQQSQQQQQ